ncbi:hypothetical protein B566_EDAN010158 [Ephemera danica]|nr:hypothetical protein B566_EDAN010158 [Ephemera danica]
MAEAGSTKMKKTVATIAILLLKVFFLAVDPKEVVIINNRMYYFSSILGVLSIISGPAVFCNTPCGFGATLENRYRTSNGMLENQMDHRIISVYEMDLCTIALQAVR